MQWNQNQSGNSKLSFENRSEGLSPKLPWKRFRNFTYRFARARLNKLALLIGFIGACLFTLLSLFFVLSWYQPVETQRWIIVTEKYTQNLAVDHTVHAAKSGLLMADLLKSGGKNLLSPETFGVFPENEIEMRHLMELKPENLERSTVDNNCKALIYQFYCHGLSDEKGPYLLIDWLSGGIGERIDPPKESDKIRVRELLQSLVKMAKGRPLAVFFDTEHSLEFQHLGVTDNKFAEKLIELEPWIESIPNLTVISSTSNDEISEMDHFESESLFGRILRKNIESPSRLGGSFTLAELFDATRENVKHEAQSVYHAQQNAVLLPFGSIGRKRAEAIRIRAMRSSSTERFLTQLSSTEKSVSSYDDKSSINKNNQTEKDVNSWGSAYQKSELGNVWATYERISKINPPPYWNYPNKWKVYKAAISRYEQLILIGEASEANITFPIIQRLSQELEQPFILPRHLINGTMSLLEKYYANTIKYQPEWLASDFEKAWADPNLNVEKPILKLIARLATLPPLTHPEFQVTIPVNVSPVQGNQSVRELTTNTSAGIKRNSGEEPGDFVSEKSNESESSLLSRLGIRSTENPKQTSKQKQSSSGLDKITSTSQTKKSDMDSEELKTTALNPATQKAVETKSKPTETDSLLTTEKTNTKEEKSDELKPVLISDMPPYQRYWLYQLILPKLQSYDMNVYDRAVKWLKFIKPSNENLPIEMHLIGLINKDLSTLGLQDSALKQDAAFNELIRSCLIFARAANDRDERANFRYIFFNHAFFWFYPEISKADDNFARGWDRFFNLKMEERQESIRDFEKANTIYLKIMKDSTEIQKNIEIYLNGMERLHDL
ncbi:MAG: hypothetical protein ACKO0V_21090, partial [bacterium]